MLETVLKALIDLIAPNVKALERKVIPAGGAVGDALTKKSGTNYDTEWAAPKVAAADTKVVLSTAQLSDNAGVATTIFSIPLSANTRYTANAVLTVAGDSSNIGILLGLTVPTGATLTMTYTGPTANNGAFINASTNTSANFVGQAVWTSGKAILTVSISITTGSTSGNGLLQFKKSGSGTFSVFQPSTLAYRTA